MVDSINELESSLRAQLDSLAKDIRAAEASLITTKEGFLNTRGEIRTHAGGLLRSLSLPLDYSGKNQSLAHWRDVCTLHFCYGCMTKHVPLCR
jgi:hypothetical protein